MPCPDHELTTLLTRVRPRLLHLFTSFHIPAEHAEDLLQEALLSLVKCWSNVREPDEWLVRAVRNICYRYLRQERYEPLFEHLEPGLLEEISSDDRPPQELRELRLDLVALASTLPPLNRRVLRMWFVEGLKNAEAAEKLGFRRRESVRQNVRRSLKLLKEGAAHQLTFRGGSRKR